MFPSTARTTTVFSADERVLLTMMYTSTWAAAPDNDQALGQGASGIVRVIAHEAASRHFPLTTGASPAHTTNRRASPFTSITNH
jgi:hypothetical protein